MPRQWPIGANPKVKNALAAGIVYFRQILHRPRLKGKSSLVRWNGAFSLFYDELRCTLNSL